MYYVVDEGESVSIGSMVFWSKDGLTCDPLQADKLGEYEARELCEQPKYSAYTCAYIKSITPEAQIFSYNKDKCADFK